MATKADAESTSGRLPTNQPQEQQQTSPAPLLPNANQPKSSSSDKDQLEDCEFAIAADLTLYANPLRCLQKTSKPSARHQPETPSEMIAADLVKYGSPLDDKPN